MVKAGTVVGVAAVTVVVVVTGFVAVVMVCGCDVEEVWMRRADVAGAFPQPLMPTSPPTARTMSTDR
jgi:hypothetical protein